jgi:carbonic anhydrase
VAPAAKGLHQSPVDIITNDVEYDGHLLRTAIQTHYIPASCHTLVNTGHSIQVNVDGAKGSGYLSSWLEGGPYRHRYQLQQFHFHWGKTNTTGSEHLLDGKGFAGELHLVHWNTELFSSFSEASTSANGLAVLAVFFKVGKEHKHLNKLTRLLLSQSVSYSGDSVEISGGFDPAVLIPGNRSNYFTYSGSLTTPPCHESVRFVVFNDPIEVSAQQINVLRQMYTIKRSQQHQHQHQRRNDGGHDGTDCRMACNCRPVQPLNDRKIIASFPAHEQ